MKAEAFRNMSSDELHARERELTDEIFHLRLRRATAQLTSPAKLQSSRRDLARVKTLLRERAGQGKAKA